jgi:hypothetical protein
MVFKNEEIPLDYDCIDIYSLIGFSLYKP